MSCWAYWEVIVTVSIVLNEASGSESATLTSIIGGNILVRLMTDSYTTLVSKPHVFSNILFGHYFDKILRNISKLLKARQHPAMLLFIFYDICSRNFVCSLINNEININEFVNFWLSVLI